jgi:superfamily I DNA/RNA helicase
MKANDLDTFLLRLEAYTTREVEKATAKNDPEKVSKIQDKTDCILCIVEGLPEGERTVLALLDAIDGLFTEVRNAVILSTIHKAKGLEAERVLWLNSSMCPSKWARQDWQIQQEFNLCYVATTRAIKELVLIEEPSR